MTRPIGSCPCGSDTGYRQCCGPLHDGSRSAATAEALMRSRYSAFCVGAADYLRDTWDPATRPDEVRLDTRVVWTRLRILDTLDGGADDCSGEVEFRAHHRIDGQPHVLHERSTFVRHAGAWLYRAGEVMD